MPKFLEVSDKAAARNYLEVSATDLSKATTGRLVLILDDNMSHHVEAMEKAEQRGQRINLAVRTGTVGSSNYLTANEIRTAHLKGHGVLCHSITHQSMTGLSDADLVTEFDSGLALRKMIGEQPDYPMDWVYPASAQDARTRSAGYLRYRRQFAGIYDSLIRAVPSHRPKPFVMGRRNWYSAIHSTVLAEVEAAAAAGNDIVVYGHAVDGSEFLTLGNTWDEYEELLDLALSLGMPVVNSAELGDPQWLADPGFEDEDYFLNNFELSEVNGGSMEIDTITGPDTIPGTKSLHLTSASNAGYAICRQLMPIPTALWQEQGVGARFGARIKTTITSGAGGASLKIINAETAADIGTGSTYTGAAWSDEGEYYRDVSAAAMALADFVVVEYRLVSCTGDAWFDNAWLSFGSVDNSA